MWRIRFKTVVIIWNFFLLCCFSFDSINSQQRPPPPFFAQPPQPFFQNPQFQPQIVQPRVGANDPNNANNAVAGGASVGTPTTTSQTSLSATTPTAPALIPVVPANPSTQFQQQQPQLDSFISQLDPFISKPVLFQISTNIFNSAGMKVAHFSRFQIWYVTSQILKSVDDRLKPDYITMLQPQLVKGIPSQNLTQALSQAHHPEVLKTLVEQSTGMLISQQAIIIQKLRTRLAEPSVIRMIMASENPAELFGYFNPPLLARNMPAIMKAIGELRETILSGTNIQAKLLPQVTLSTWLATARKQGKVERWTADDLVGKSFFGSSSHLDLALLGLGCNELELVTEQDVLIVIGRYRHELYELRKRAQLQLPFPLNIRNCAMERVLEYLKQKNNGTSTITTDVNILSTLHNAEIDMIGGEILSGIPAPALDNVPAETRQAILEEIGKVDSIDLFNLLSSPSWFGNKLYNDLLNSTQAQQQAMALPSPMPGLQAPSSSSGQMSMSSSNSNNLQIPLKMGNLLFYSHDFLTGNWSKDAITEILASRTGSYCLSKQLRRQWAELLLSTFGPIPQWTASDLASIGDLLVVLTPSDLNTIPVETLARGVATILRQSGFHSSAGGSRGASSFIHKCVGMLDDGQEFYMSFKLFMRKLTQATQLMVNSVRTIDEVMLNEMSRGPNRVRRAVQGQAPRTSGATDPRFATLAPLTAEFALTQATQRQLQSQQRPPTRFSQFRTSFISRTTTSPSPAPLPTITGSPAQNQAQAQPQTPPATTSPSPPPLPTTTGSPSQNQAQAPPQTPPSFISRATISPSPPPLPAPTGSPSQNQAQAQPQTPPSSISRATTSPSPPPIPTPTGSPAQNQAQAQPQTPPSFISRATTSPSPPPLPTPTGSPPQDVKATKPSSEMNQNPSTPDTPKHSLNASTVDSQGQVQTQKQTPPPPASRASSSATEAARVSTDSLVTQSQDSNATKEEDRRSMPSFDMPKDSIDIPITCRGMKAAGPAAIGMTLADFKQLSTEDLFDCVEPIGLIEWDMDTKKELLALMSQKLHLTPDRVNILSLIELGGLVSAFGVADNSDGSWLGSNAVNSTFDISGIDLTLPDSIDALSILGTQIEEPEVLKILADKFTLQNQISAKMRGAVSRPDNIRGVIWSLGNLICGMDDQIVAGIFDSDRSLFVDVSPMLGKVVGCHITTLQILTESAILPSNYGDPSTWTEQDVEVIGVVVAGLKPSQLATIQPSSFAGLTPLAVQQITPAAFQILSPAQVGKMSYESAITIQAHHLEVLSQDQMNALTGVTSVQSEAFNVPDVLLRGSGDNEDGASGDLEVVRSLNDTTAATNETIAGRAVPDHATGATGAGAGVKKVNGSSTTPTTMLASDSDDDLVEIVVVDDDGSTNASDPTSKTTNKTRHPVKDKETSRPSSASPFSLQCMRITIPSSLIFVLCFYLKLWL